MLFYRNKVVANLLATGCHDVAVGGASHGPAADWATCHVLHIQRQLGMHFNQSEKNNNNAISCFCISECLSWLTNK